MTAALSCESGARKCCSTQITGHCGNYVLCETGETRPNVPA